MLTKSQSKYIRALSMQKYRNEHQVFIAEGTKIAEEWLQSTAKVQLIAATKAWSEVHQGLLKQHPEATYIEVSDAELATISLLPTPNQVLLVVHREDVPMPNAITEWCIAVSTLQDPGNMGTIIRIADWFGIKHIYATADSVDAYNPKVIQAAMGGHLRVQVHTATMQQVFEMAQVPIYAAVLGGTNIYHQPKAKAGVLVIGNESKGLPEDVQAMATHKITIPRIGGAESLNAGVSAGIICALLMDIA